MKKLLPLPDGSAFPMRPDSTEDRVDRSWDLNATNLSYNVNNRHNSGAFDSPYDAYGLESTEARRARTRNTTAPESSTAAGRSTPAWHVSSTKAQDMYPVTGQFHDEDEDLYPITNRSPRDDRFTTQHHQWPTPQGTSQLDQGWGMRRASHQSRIASQAPSNDLQGGNRPKHAAVQDRAYHGRSLSTIDTNRRRRQQGYEPEAPQHYHVTSSAPDHDPDHAPGGWQSAGRAGVHGRAYHGSIFSTIGANRHHQQQPYEPEAPKESRTVINAPPNDTGWLKHLEHVKVQDRTLSRSIFSPYTASAHLQQQKAEFGASEQSSDFTNNLSWGQRAGRTGTQTQYHPRSPFSAWATSMHSGQQVPELRNSISGHAKSWPPKPHDYSDNYANSWPHSLTYHKEHAELEDDEEEEEAADHFPYNSGPSEPHERQNWRRSPPPPPERQLFY